MFIVIDYQNNAAIGDTLEEAYKNYEDDIEETPDIDDCTWYEATEIKVKQKIEKVEKTTITKVPAKRS